NLITKVYFPRMIIPMAAVASGLLDFVVAFVLMGVLMVWYGVLPGVGILILPVLVFLTSILAIFAGMWMSALNVKYRDIRYALPFLIQLGLFVTTIIYPLRFVPEKWRWALSLRPLAGQVDAYRKAFFGLPFDWGRLGISAAVTVAL